MPPIAVLGITVLGHGCWVPSPITGSASTVTAGSILVAREGDAVATHPCIGNAPPCPRAGGLSFASPDVFVENKSCSYMTAGCKCGGLVTGGIGSVIVN